MWTCPVDSCQKICADEPEYRKHIREAHPDMIQKTGHFFNKKVVYPKRLEA